MNFVLYFLGFLLLLVLLFEVARIVVHARKAVMAGRQTTKAYNEHPTPEAKVLIIGDSTSYGTGAREQKNSLAGRLCIDFPETEVINESENGMGIRRLHEKISLLEDRKINVVLLHIGGVDTILLTREKVFKEYLEKIHTLCVQKFSVDTIILVSVNNTGAIPLMRFPLNILYDIWSKKITEACVKVSTTHTMVHVPLYHEYHEDPLAKDVSTFFSDDKIHPNDEGYGIWYQEVSTVLHDKKLL